MLCWSRNRFHLSGAKNWKSNVDLFLNCQAISQKLGHTKERTRKNWINLLLVLEQYWRKRFWDFLMVLYGKSLYCLVSPRNCAKILLILLYETKQTKFIYFSIYYKNHLESPATFHVAKKEQNKTAKSIPVYHLLKFRTMFFG